VAVIGDHDVRAGCVHSQAVHGHAQRDLSTDLCGGVAAAQGKGSASAAGDQAAASTGARRPDTADAGHTEGAALCDVLEALHGCTALLAALRQPAESLRQPAESMRQPAKQKPGCRLSCCAELLARALQVRC